MGLRVPAFKQLMPPVPRSLIQSHLREHCDPLLFADFTLHSVVLVIAFVFVGHRHGAANLHYEAVDGSTSVILFFWAEQPLVEAGRERIVAAQAAAEAGGGVEVQDQRDDQQEP